MESAESSTETSPDGGCRLKKTGCRDEDTGGLVASMRRLKIQENLLETAARSAIEDQNLKVVLHAVAAKRNKDCTEIKNTFLELKSLLDRFKYNVSSPECLKKMEIKEYKQMVVELDKKIISFKRFLAKELNVLRVAENTLTAEIKEAECELSDEKDKLAAKPYITIVPSSVKAMRNTPSACPEVQKFQEFLNSGGGHRGDWGEQEHALFLSCRRHCAGAATSVDSASLDRMVDILVEKIPGLAAEEVLKHEKWYCEYARLKAEQRAALDRWRGRRQLAKQQLRRFQLHVLEHSTHTKNAKPTKLKSTVQKASEERKLNVGEIVESQEYDQTKSPNKIITEPKNPSNSSSTRLKTERICHSTKTERNCHSTKTERNCHSTKTERDCHSTKTERDCHSTKTEQSCDLNKTSNTRTQNARVVPNKDIEDCQEMRTNSKDNEELYQKEVVQIKNVGNYLKPTKAWSIKTEKDDESLAANDFRLHIPMANAPKLGISNWRRCLVEELS